MVARASVCLTIHNRLSDTNQPRSNSRGLTTVLPMDYATQTLNVANALPRLPDELDIWQFIINDKTTAFDVSVRITLDVTASRVETKPDLLVTSLQISTIIFNTKTSTTPHHTFSDRTCC